MKIDKATQDLIFNSCLDDSTKIIRYFEEQEKRNKPYRIITLTLSITSAVGAVIAAIAGVLSLL